MRPIKFRAWHDGLMYDVYNISYDKFDTNKTIQVDMINNEAHALYHSSNPDTFVLMQYTGIKDSSGKDIYEGDICTAEGRMVYSSSAKAMVPDRYTVYWRDDRWHLRDQNGDGYQSDDYYYADEIDWQRCTVIGNIYEQQEHN